jgi:uncharacterized ParB-like nuclease family protein
MPETLKIDRIRLDGGTQPRSTIDMDVVADYAEAMERGDEFPPVSVIYDGNDYWLYDGFHRVRAAEKRGEFQIRAEVEQGTREDAVWKSLAANQKHGLRRSEEDKRRVIKRALKGWGDNRSDQEIADHVGAHRHTVLKYRHELKESTCRNSTSADKRRGKDGRVQDTSNIGSSQPTTPSDDETQSSPTSPQTRGDGAPPEDASSPGLGGGESGEHRAGQPEEDYVTPEEAAARAYNRIAPILEDPSRLRAELEELKKIADEIPQHVRSKLVSELEETGHEFLEFAQSIDHA